MAINLLPLCINRVILHEVFGHAPHTETKPPVKGTELIVLEGTAKKAVEDRIVQVLGRQSQSIEVVVEDDSHDSTFQACARLLDHDDASFVSDSCVLAERLAAAQATKAVPGGLVVVFSGFVGHPSKRFIAVLKAEKQGGFVRHIADTGVAIEYLTEIFLTEDAKLYKIGFFQEDQPADDTGFRDAAHFTVQVYDHLITRGNRETAAQYFYKSFLGCAFSKSSKTLTRKVYIETQKFLNTAELSQEERLDIGTALYSYVKVSNKQTIDYAEFARDSMPAAVHDAYINHMASVGLPAHAIPKDLSALENELKRRSIVMDGKIRLTAPSDVFREKVKIWTPPDDPEITMIKVQGKITEQR